MAFVIENIRSDNDLQKARAEAFLSENPDPGVRLRPREQLQLALSTGQGLLVSRDSQICGVSLVYQFDAAPYELVHYEIGSMRVTAEGFGLQVALAQVHIMQIYLEDDQTRDSIFAVVTPDTASSFNMSARVGMVPWKPTTGLQYLRANAGIPFLPEKSVLAANQETISNSFEGLSSLHVEDRSFRTPKKEDRIELAMGWFDPALLGCGPRRAPS